MQNLIFTAGTICFITYGMFIGAIKPKRWYHWVIALSLLFLGNYILKDIWFEKQKLLPE